MGPGAARHRVRALPAPHRRGRAGGRTRSARGRLAGNREPVSAGRHRARRDRAAGHGEPVLAGAVRFDERDRPRNTLFAVTGTGGVAALYDKWHLVPFGEYQPSWAQIGIQLVPGGGFAPARVRETLRIPGVPPVGPLICYEAIFPGQVVDEADRPDWMVNVTNDAWFGTSAGPRQHLAAARLRAVEEGLPLLRAANTGITAAFDSRGHEITRIGMEQTGFRTVTLPGACPARFSRGLGWFCRVCWRLVSSSRDWRWRVRRRRVRSALSRTQKKTPIPILERNATIKPDA